MKSPFPRLALTVFVLSLSALFAAPEEFTCITVAGVPNAGLGVIDAFGNFARFGTPIGVATDNSGNVYITDNNTQTIRRLGTNGEVTTVAGLAHSPGFSDGVGSVARFLYPLAIAIDGVGNLFVADGGNDAIRRIGTDGLVTTFAGGFRGTNDGQGRSAAFNRPSGIAIANSGNVYVADADNHIVRKITASGAVSTYAGKAGVRGNMDGVGGAARFDTPGALTIDSSEKVYVADYYNSRICWITPDARVTTIALTGL